MSTPPFSSNRLQTEDSLSTLDCESDDARAFLPEGLLGTPPSTPLPGSPFSYPAAYPILPPQAVYPAYGFDPAGVPIPGPFAGLMGAPRTPPVYAVQQQIQPQPQIQPRTTTVWATKTFDEQGHDNRLALWVGNLPPDCTEDELWDFFAECDVTSVRVLSASRCGFVNMASEDQVDYAAKRYHERIFRGMQIVVRARKTFKFAVTKRAEPQVFGGDPLMSMDGQEGIFRDPRLQQRWLEARRLVHPGMNNRYFIMRSLSDVDLELSVAHGVWATQKRNTATLNAAFEGSQNVYLIFSVLGSNSWYGIARMEAPIPASKTHAVTKRLDGTQDPFAGEFFQIKWIVSNAHLPFSDTEHVVNPWNQGSLVKRSVDGTEIHPGWAENLVAAISGAANRLSLDKLTFVSRTMAGISDRVSNDQGWARPRSLRNQRSYSDPSLAPLPASNQLPDASRLPRKLTTLPPLPQSAFNTIPTGSKPPYLTISIDGYPETADHNDDATSIGVHSLVGSLNKLGLKSTTPLDRPSEGCSPYFI